MPNFSQFCAKWVLGFWYSYHINELKCKVKGPIISDLNSYHCNLWLFMIFLWSKGFYPRVSLFTFKITRNKFVWMCGSNVADLFIIYNANYYVTLCVEYLFFMLLWYLHVRGILDWYDSTTISPSFPLVPKCMHSWWRINLALNIQFYVMSLCLSVCQTLSGYTKLRFY